MNSLYKVIGLLLALIIFPIAFFTPLIKINIVSEAMSLLGGGQSSLLNEAYSVKELLELSNGSGAKINFKEVLGKIPEDVKSRVGMPFLLAGIFLALALLTALALCVLFLTAKNKKLCLLAAVAGILFTIAANVAFGRFAAPFLDGTIALGKLLSESGLLTQFMGGSLGGIFGSILLSLIGNNASIISVKTLELSSAYIFMLMAYGGAAVWTGAYSLMEMK